VMFQLLAVSLKQTFSICHSGESESAPEPLLVLDNKSKLKLILRDKALQ
jgi:hypothetical protein